MPFFLFFDLDAPFLGFRPRLFLFEGNEVHTFFVVHLSNPVSVNFLNHYKWSRCSQKISTNDLWLEFYGPKWFWTFWRKFFTWFLTSEIVEIFESGASKIFNSLNFRLARKKSLFFRFSTHFLHSWRVEISLFQSFFR